MFNRRSEDPRLIVLEKDMKLILTNHLPHINSELVGISTILDGYKTLLKWQFGILASIIVLVVGAFIGLLIT